MRPEMLLTLASDPWAEIGRVAEAYHCESLLLGFTSLADKENEQFLEQVLSAASCDVSVLAAPEGWKLDEVHRVLVPIGGGRTHDVLRARLLASLCRTGPREVTFLRVIPENAASATEQEARHGLDWLCREEALGAGKGEVVRSNDPAKSIAEAAARSDLVILGLQRLGKHSKAFGKTAVRIARSTAGATIMISRAG